MDFRLSSWISIFLNPIPFRTSSHLNEFRKDYTNILSSSTKQRISIDTSVPMTNLHSPINIRTEIQIKPEVLFRSSRFFFSNRIVRTAATNTGDAFLEKSREIEINHDVTQPNRYGNRRNCQNAKRK